MATAADVRQRVGEDLGIVPIGQALEAQDQARIDAAYAETYETLKDRGLASWAFSGDIPTKLMPDLCLLIEEKLALSYSIPDNRFVRIKTSAGEGGDIAISNLARLTIQEYSSCDSPQDY